MVRSTGFQPENMGSIPIRVTMFQQFRDEDLDRWIKPREFSFGPSGENESLQPGSPQQHLPINIAEQTQTIRYALAKARQEAGYKPLFWMVK